MRFAWVSLLWIALGTGAFVKAGQQEGSPAIRYKLAPQSLIEQRLRSYTRKNSTREPELETLFLDAGCAGDALTEHPVPHEKAPNLVCTLEGTTQSTIIVGAHFDLVEAGSGVVDNWSGASLLPSLYQGLAGTERQHTFKFVAFCGEEDGLVGSKAFVKELGSEGRKHAKAMVNMDTLGLSDTEIWVSRADPKLVEILGSVAKATNLPVTGMNVERVGSTDSESFREHKIPAITVHSLTQSTLSILHSPRDRIEAIDMNRYYASYRLIVAYLAALDQRLD